jgi:hypothetical protein
MRLAGRGARRWMRVLVSKDKKPVEMPPRLRRRKLTEREAEHARKVEARNDWLQRGRTGGSPEAIYGGRPPMEKKSDD